MLDAPLTANDFYYAIKHNSRGKSPGTYVEVPTSCLPLAFVQKRFLGRSQKLSSVGFTEQDAKLGPKALAYRLNHVIRSLLGVDQFGFMPGRNIRHAL
ncbi:unnamed protein product [Peronospora farinosa]|uniref:Reverse transcriptase domain-containing protein n=1 Tax=Peronospora farinosa TaxID=134698 RepID=A0AAV0T0Q2_9STRA|nr:unnamed protein product [Peronospora farinosa]